MEDLPGRPARRRGLRITVAVLLVLAGLGGVALVRAVQRSLAHACNVCVGYRGRTVCREAVAPERDEAISIARERACAFLAAAGAERETCVETPPASVDCRGD